MEEKICTCDPSQGNIKAEGAVDIINQMGKIIARYDPKCNVHGFKRLETKEKTD